jgi:hypothetical protein
MEFFGRAPSYARKRAPLERAGTASKEMAAIIAR